MFLRSITKLNISFKIISDLRRITGSSRRKVIKALALCIKDVIELDLNFDDNSRFFSDWDYIDNKTDLDFLDNMINPNTGRIASPPIDEQPLEKWRSTVWVGDAVPNSYNDLGALPAHKNIKKRPILRRLFGFLFNEIEDDYVPDLTNYGIEPNPGPPKNKNKNNSNKVVLYRKPRMNKQEYDVIKIFMNDGPMPKFLVAYTRWQHHAMGYNNVGFKVGALSNYANSIFAPDVSGTDVSSALLATYFTAIYDRCLVVETLLVFDVCNEEDFDIVIVVAPSLKDMDPLLTTPTKVLEMAEMPLAQKVVVERGSGMNRRRIKIRVNWGRFVGNKASYKAETGWQSFGTAYPAYKTYFNVGIASLENLVNGITFSYTHYYKVRWTNRIYSDVETIVHTHEHPDPEAAALRMKGLLGTFKFPEGSEKFRKNIVRTKSAR